MVKSLIKQLFKTEPIIIYLWRFDLYQRSSSEEVYSILIPVLATVELWRGKKSVIRVAECVAALVDQYFDITIFSRPWNRVWLVSQCNVSTCDCLQQMWCLSACDWSVDVMCDLWLVSRYDVINCCQHVTGCSSEHGGVTCDAVIWWLAGVCYRTHQSDDALSVRRWVNIGKLFLWQTVSVLDSYLWTQANCLLLLLLLAVSTRGMHSSPASPSFPSLTHPTNPLHENPIPNSRPMVPFPFSYLSQFLREFV